MRIAIVALLGGCNALIGIDDFSAPAVDDASTIIDDAPPMLDAYDATMREAEQWVQSSTTGGRTWELETALAGYSGSGYMRVAPGGAVCSDMNAVSQCAPELGFDLYAANAGGYVVELRAQAASSAEDSVWVMVIQASSRVAVQILANAQWNMASTSVTIPTAGVYRVFVAMREPGFAFDAIRLVPTPP